MIILYVIGKDGNNSKSISDDKCGMSIHWEILKYYKKNEVLIDVTAQKNLGNFKQREMS